MSGVPAIGFTGSDQRNPTGLGFGRPGGSNIGGVNNTDTGLLTRCAAALEALQANLAPNNQFMTKASFNAVAAGASAGQTKVNDDFNGLINCLQRGVINVFFGNPGAVYDMQLGPVANPTPIMFPFRSERIVNWVVDASSPTSAFGAVYVTRS